MAKNKTTPTEANVEQFIYEFANNEQKKADSFKLIQLMKEISGENPYMWGPSIIGFGSYHYKYASGHEGDAPLLGFSPRKSKISLYVYTGTERQKALLNKLGKYTMGKACIYINKLQDIDTDILKEIMRDTLQHYKQLYA